MVHDASPNRIPGLVWEDRVRTTNLFRTGSVAEHPTSPTDIAPDDDIQQGLPTHVKSVKRNITKSGREADHSIGMACAYQLFRMQGYQRLVIGIYEIEPEKALCSDSKMRKVYRFTEVVEVILSPATLSAFQGDVTLAEIASIRDALLSHDYDWDDLEEARARFQLMTDQIRPRMGLARCSNKFNEENKRIQAAVSLKALQKQMATEGDYHGRFTQPNIIRHTESFHGLPLPWRTTANERIFKKKRDPGKVTRRKNAKGVSQDNMRYLGRHVSETTIKVEGGEMVIARYPDEKRTIRAESSDDTVRRHVSHACKNAGGTWIAAGRRWLLDLEGAKAVVDAIAILELPSSDGESIMRPIKSKHELFEFAVPEGRLRTLRLPEDNWAIQADNDDLANRVEIVCKKYKIGRQIKSKGNWLIPQEPEDHMERVARALQRHVI